MFHSCVLLLARQDDIREIDYGFVKAYVNNSDEDSSTPFMSVEISGRLVFSDICLSGDPVPNLDRSAKAFPIKDWNGRIIAYLADGTRVFGEQVEPGEPRHVSISGNCMVYRKGIVWSSGGSTEYLRSLWRRYERVSLWNFFEGTTISKPMDSVGYPLTSAGKNCFLYAQPVFSKRGAEVVVSKFEICVRDDHFKKVQSFGFVDMGRTVNQFRECFLDDQLLWTHHKGRFESFDQNSNLRGRILTSRNRLSVDYN